MSEELYLDEDFRMLAKTYPADVSAIGVTVLIDYVEALEAELARRDEIIARLKEDAERLAKLNCHCHDTRGMTFLDDNYHAPDCSITLHRELVKELE